MITQPLHSPSDWEGRFEPSDKAAPNRCQVTLMRAASRLARKMPAKKCIGEASGLLIVGIQTDVEILSNPSPSTELPSGG